MDNIDVYLPRAIMDYLELKENDSFIENKKICYVFKIEEEEI